MSEDVMDLSIINPNRSSGLELLSLSICLASVSCSFRLTKLLTSGVGLGGSRLAGDDDGSARSLVSDQQAMAKLWPSALEPNVGAPASVMSFVCWRAYLSCAGRARLRLSPAKMQSSSLALRHADVGNDLEGLYLMRSRRERQDSYYFYYK